MKGMKKKKLSGGQMVFSVLFAALAAVIGISLYFLLREKPLDMETAYNVGRQEAYDKYYQMALDSAEEKNHVANYGMINIGDVREMSRLEVLKVSGTEFVIENAQDNDQNITSWIEVRGIGIFTVDLTLAQFAADSSRGYVLVRVPGPQLTECRVEETGKQLWKNDCKNDSIGDGVRLSQAQLGEGQKLLEDSRRSSRRFYDAAMESAEWMIQLLVRQWNPQIPDLESQVEFADDLV